MGEQRDRDAKGYNQEREAGEYERQHAAELLKAIDHVLSIDITRTIARLRSQLQTVMDQNQNDSPAFDEQSWTHLSDVMKKLHGLDLLHAQIEDAVHDLAHPRFARR
jgi:hypothetical protein